MTNIVYNMDCMDGMKEYTDGYFDLAVVDPPYGIENAFKETSAIRKYGDIHVANDLKPTREYFDELMRVSKNQIIWGYNHLSDMLPATKEFIFWYKHQPVNTYADGELAWTSFKKTAKCFDYPYFGNAGGDSERIHPTQKPLALYRWIYQKYAKPGYKILDTHVGSGTSRRAAYEAGLDFVGFEIEPEYFQRQEEAFQEFAAQQSLFVNE